MNGSCPFSFWKIPIEHIMSIINLHLKSVRIMRREENEDFERAIMYAKNLTQA